MPKLAGLSVKIYFSERRWFYREPDALPQRKEPNKRRKTHVKKKILAVFLSLCMAMSLLPVTALATGEDTPSTQAVKTLPAADENGVITLKEDVTLGTD